MSETPAEELYLRGYRSASKTWNGLLRWLPVSLPAEDDVRYIRADRYDAQAAEVARLEALVVSRVRASADAIVEIASQAAEIERLETLVIDITDLDLIDHDRRKEIAALREQLQKAQSALQMTSDWFAAAQAEAELHLIPNNDCNQYWFVSRMLWHLDGPTQRALKAAIDAAMEEPKP
jgi:hypothetical protein